MARGKRSDAQLIKREQTTIEALQLRAAGLSYRDIGEKLGIGRQTAHTQIQKAFEKLAEQRSEETAVTRMILAERVGMVYAALAEQVKRGDLKAIDRWLEAIKLEARLFGIVSAPPVAIQNNIVLSWPDQSQPAPPLPSDVIIMGGD